MRGDPWGLGSGGVPNRAAAVVAMLVLVLVAGRLDAVLQAERREAGG